MSTEDKTGVLTLGLEARKILLPEIVEAHIEKYGKVDTHLVGIDGNAFAIMHHIARALRKARWPEHAVRDVLDLMMGVGREYAFEKDYNHLLRVAMSVVEDPMKGADEWNAWNEIRQEDL